MALARHDCFLFLFSKQKMALILYELQENFGHNSQHEYALNDYFSWG